MTGAGSSEGNLCLECGLCCGDSMYSQINLGEGDRERLARSGYPADLSGATSIPLPCPMLSGTRCTIYANRPGKCAAYRCEVLKGLDVGTIPYATALERVREAKRLLARAREGMPEGVTMAHFRARSAADRGGAPPDPAETAALFAYYAYARYMDRHFRRADKRLVTRDAETRPDDSAA